MGSLVIESTSSCPGTYSYRGTSICLEYQQFSRAPPVVRSTYGCREHLQLSNSRKYLHMPRAVNQSTSSCRGDLQIVGNISVCQEQLSRVPRLVEGTSNSGTCREQLSGVPRVVEGPPIVRSISVCREQLSGVPRVVEGPPSVRSISVSQEHEQLSKVPPVVESTYSCPKYLQLSRVIFVRQGAS